MAMTQRITSGHWVVHLQSPSRSVLKVEVYMSREQAQRLLNPKIGSKADPIVSTSNLGEAVLNRLSQ